jgi:subtilisin family serine protease
MSGGWNEWKRRIVLGGLGLVLMLGAACCRDLPERPRFTEKEKRQGYSDWTILVTPHPALPDTSFDKAEREAGFVVRRTFNNLGGIRVLERSAKDTRPITEVASSLRRSHGNIYARVELDYIKKACAVAPNDPNFSRQWPLNNAKKNPGAKLRADIKAKEGWEKQSGAPGIIVAIIDSGANTNHPDLVANLWRNSGETGRDSAGKDKSTNGFDDDNNGYIDDVHGINTLIAKDVKGNGVPVDISGHGTAVAGIIGAVGDNNRNLTGVAWSVQLMILKSLDDEDYGRDSEEMACIDYAVSKGAVIINASYAKVGSQSPDCWDAMMKAYKKARGEKIVLVCAAGNDTEDIDQKPYYPAALLMDNVVTVANSDHADKLTMASTNYGAGTVDLAAPGTNMPLLTKDGLDNTKTPQGTEQEINNWPSGTSFSAPQVTGALALAKAHFPNESYRESINRVLRSVDRVSTHSRHTATGGRLNLGRLLTNDTNNDKRPFNDDFSKRSVLAGDWLTARGSSEYGGRQNGEPHHAGDNNGGPTLWWTWTPTGSLHGNVTIDTRDSEIDTVLGVYTGTRLSNLEAVAVINDGTLPATTSALKFCAEEQTAYHIAVGGKNGAAGFIVLRLQFENADVWVQDSCQGQATSPQQQGPPQK